MQSEHSGLHSDIKAVFNTQSRLMVIQELYMHLNTQTECKTNYCFEFRRESNGIFVLGLVNFSSDNFVIFN